MQRNPADGTDAAGFLTLSMRLIAAPHMSAAPVS